MRQTSSTAFSAFGRGVLNQGILGALSVGTPDTDPGHLATWGRWVKNACITHAWNAGQEVKYW